MKKILTFLLVAVLVFVFAYLLTRGAGKITPQRVEKQEPFGGRVFQKDDFTKDYSSLYKTTPGKSSPPEVIKINGSPNSVVKKENKTYFYYNTPSRDFKNIVLFENDIEVFALENIFGDYRGDFQSFSKAYGQSIKLYDKNSPFIWHVFLQKGIGVETNEKDITKVLYFVPQDENSFLVSISGELNLAKDVPRPEVLRP